jgi:hypothetical protein
VLGGRDDEQPGDRVDVAGLARLDRGAMGRQDRGSVRVIEGQALRVRLEQAARRRGLAHGASSQTRARRGEAVDV